MSIKSSIIDSLNEDMDSVNKVNDKSLVNFRDFITGKVPKDVEVLASSNLSFKIPKRYMSVLGKKYKPFKRFGKNNVYEISLFEGDNSALLVEFTDTSLPIPVCLIFNTMEDRLDVACGKLCKAFNDGVNKTDIVAESFGYLRSGITYNTVKGNGTFCTECDEVVQSFLSIYLQSKYGKVLRKYLIDSGLCNYITFHDIIFGSTFIPHNKPDLFLDLWFNVQHMDKVSKIVSTFKGDTNLRMFIEDDSLRITLALRG